MSSPGDVVGDDDVGEMVESQLDLVRCKGLGVMKSAPREFRCLPEEGHMALVSVKRVKLIKLCFTSELLQVLHEDWMSGNVEWGHLSRRLRGRRRKIEEHRRVI